MRKDLISFKKIKSSFLSCDQDVRKILKILFVENRPYSDVLKRLLIINTPDCLDMDNKEYQQFVRNFSVADLLDKGYIRLNPKIARGTHQEIKSYIIISLDNFSPNNVSVEYRDYTIHFDVVCYNDAWVLDDYKVRPLLICGYIDGILNSLSDQSKATKNSYQSQIKLSGIGNYEFLGCNEVVLNEDLSMYSLAYEGVHFVQDLGVIKGLDWNE